MSFIYNYFETDHLPCRLPVSHFHLSWLVMFLLFTHSFHLHCHVSGIPFYLSFVLSCAEGPSGSVAAWSCVCGPVVSVFASRTDVPLVVEQLVCARNGNNKCISLQRELMCTIATPTSNQNNQYHNIWKWEEVSPTGKKTYVAWNKLARLIVSVLVCNNYQGTKQTPNSEMIWTTIVYSMFRQVSRELSTHCVRTPHKREDMAALRRVQTTV